MLPTFTIGEYTMAPTLHLSNSGMADGQISAVSVSLAPVSVLNEQAIGELS